MTYQIAHYGSSRFFGVYDEAGDLICVTVYKKGAAEVIRRLTILDQALATEPPAPASMPIAA